MSFRLIIMACFLGITAFSLGGCDGKSSSAVSSEALGPGIDAKSRSLTLSLARSLVPADSYSSLTVGYFDVHGRAIIGARVLLSGVNISFDSETGETDADGYFGTVFTAGSDTGEFTIFAQAEDVVASATVTIE